MLTRQLLAFSRRQMLDPIVLDLGEVVRGLTPMLERLIGEDIAVELRSADTLPEVLRRPGTDRAGGDQPGGQRARRDARRRAPADRDARRRRVRPPLASPTPGSGSRRRPCRTSSSPSTPPSRWARGQGSGSRRCTARSPSRAGTCACGLHQARARRSRSPCPRPPSAAGPVRRRCAANPSAAARRSCSARTRRACARSWRSCSRAPATACSARRDRPTRSSAPRSRTSTRS